MTTTDPTPLAEQIAREHRATLNTSTWLIVGCSCDPALTAPANGVAGAWYAAHIATVTEQAVRKLVAAELVDTQGALAEYLTAWAVGGARVWAETPTEAAADILDRLARIAQGGTHA